MGKIYEIANEVGVSTATVSRVFNKKPYVKEEIRQKVLGAARRLGYSPKFTVRKDNIAIIVEGLDKINLGNYETLLIATISRYLIKERFNFEIIPIHEIDFLHQNFIEGALAILYDSESIKKIKTVANNVPVLTINYPLENFHGVYSDHKQGMKLAVEYLAKHRHARIGLFLDYLTSWGSKERIKGYQESVKEFHLEFDEERIQSREKQSIFESVARIVKTKPTALIIASEDSVLPVTYALHLLDKKIPADISVVSYENKRISQYLSPPHTTISQHLEEMAEISVEKMAGIVRGEENGKVVVAIENGLIERDSVKKEGGDEQWKRKGK